MSTWTSRICILSLALAGSLLSATNGFAAAVFTVDSILDQIDDDTSDGICHTAANTCTLRAAVMSANKVSGTDDATIVLPAGIYTLIRPADATDGDDNGDLNLTAPVSGTPAIIIRGAGAGATIIDANHIDRVLSVDAGRSANISGVTLRTGSVPAGKDGGGIYNSGVLTLVRCVLSGNTAGGDGGGILNKGTVALSYSTVSGNVAANDGGGIASFFAGTLDVSQSTISGNTAHSQGGGIASAAALSIKNSTIALNNSDGNGGGIYNIGNTLLNANIYSSTIAYNDADHEQNLAGSGGGVFLDGTGGNGFNLYNTILAANTVSNFLDYDDCAGISGGTLKTHARNLFGSAISCTIDQISGNYDALDPPAFLGGLQNNGGPTQTIALLSGSNAIDGTILGVGCRDSQSAAIAIDQRGYARGADSACDVGAYEYNDIFANGFE